MIIKEVIFKNFQSFDDSEQKVNLLTNDITLITGYNEINKASNGSGKSSIIDSIIWCLFGKTRSSADEVVNKYSGKKNCKVQLNFSIDTDEYEVIRYRKHEKQGNKLYIFKNKKDISCDNNTDTQNLITDIIRIKYDAFISSLIFDKENYKPFLSATPTERLSIIENVLIDIGTLNKYFDRTKQILKKAKEKNDEIKEKEKSIKQDISNTETTIEKYNNSVELKKENIQKEIKILQNNKNKLNIDDPEKILNDIVNLENLNVEKTNLENNIKSLNKQLNKDDLTRRILKNEREIEILKNEITNLENNEDICPVCKQKTTKQIIDKEKQKLENKINILKSENETLEIENKENTEHNKNINDSIDNYYNQLKKVEEKIKLIPKSLLTKEEVLNSKENIKNIDEQINIKTSNLNNLYDEEFVFDLTEKLKKLNIEYIKNNKLLIKSNEQIIHLEYFYDLFSNKKGGFKKYLISKILSVLNDKVNQYITNYFSYNITVNFNSSLTEEIFVEKEKYNFNEFSSGEKMRLELSCVFALFYIIKSYLGVKNNLLILDEILDLNLDSLGIKYTIDILNSLKDEGNSIFIISHKNDYLDHFSKKIKVIKEKTKKSRIEFNE